MPSLALVCIQAIVLMMVCHPFPSEVGSRFIDATGTMGTIDAGSTTIFGTFLFRTTSSDILVAFSD